MGIRGSSWNRAEKGWAYEVCGPCEMWAADVKYMIVAHTTDGRSTTDSKQQPRHHAQRHMSHHHQHRHIKKARECHWHAL